MLLYLAHDTAEPDVQHAHKLKFSYRTARCATLGRTLYSQVTGTGCARRPRQASIRGVALCSLTFNG